MARQLRDADNLIAPAVRATINALDLAPEDAAAVRLAERYAAAIDTAELDYAAAMETIGPKLLAALESLGATPKARAALKKGAGNAGPSKLDQLRSRGA